MANLPLGTWIPRRLLMTCKDCLKTGEWPQGERSEDGVWEVRSCPNEKCASTWTTQALYVSRPGEATETNAF
ncbi:hypothetical protein Slala03_81220 [Streptomyces lavendulae subsp. lavendulae]|nr:hypothetical protein Slala03_81220 [Streptomyces lavendulae subsp. lavendulae]